MSRNKGIVPRDLLMLVFFLKQLLLVPLDIAGKDFKFLQIPEELFVFVIDTLVYSPQGNWDSQVYSPLGSFDSPLYSSPSGLGSHDEYKGQTTKTGSQKSLLPGCQDSPVIHTLGESLFATWCTAACRQRINTNGFSTPYDLFSWKRNIKSK